MKMVVPEFLKCDQTWIGKPRIEHVTGLYDILITKLFQSLTQPFFYSDIYLSGLIKRKFSHVIYFAGADSQNIGLIFFVLFLKKVQTPNKTPKTTI